MKSLRLVLAALLGVALLMASLSASAQDSVKIGVIAAFSGPFAEYGKQIDAGIKAYLKQHGDNIAGKKLR